MPTKIFVSHESNATREAVEFKRLILEYSTEVQVFLSSDWDSLASGEPWFNLLVDEIRHCDELFVMVTRHETFNNLWINFEIGMFFGRKKSPKILIFGGFPVADIPHPIGGLQLIHTWNTNRWVKDLRDAGVNKIDEGWRKFGELFQDRPFRN
jgi:hypothetical protein